MWPFRKIKITLEADWRRDAIKQMKEWRPVGATFNYLGRTMVVTGHTMLVQELRYSFSLAPQLYADYADNNGVIHSVFFPWYQAKSMMEAQP